jgi:translation initiation factor IF-3
MVELRRAEVSVELRPTLSQCIETVTKREYWRSVDEYLKAKTDDKELEERIQLLKLFLDTADFKALRSQSERYITEGKEITFTLFVKGGKVSHKMSIE